MRRLGWHEAAIFMSIHLFFQLELPERPIL